MSRIGKQPIQIPEGVEVKKENDVLVFSGKKGEIKKEIPESINVEINNGKIFVSLKEGKITRKIKALWGLYRNLYYNAVKGVSEGFQKKLEITGVGYKAKVEGKDLVLNIGFSHPVKIECPEEIEFSAEKNSITVSGIDKEKVGDIAAKIRRIRKADPYKGKGIKYEGEKIRRKEGKKAAGAEGAA